MQRALRDLAVKRHPPHLLPIVGGFGAGVGGEMFGDRSDLDVLCVRVALEAADPDTCDLRREVGAFAVPFLTTAPSRLREVWGSAAGGRGGVVGVLVVLVGSGAGRRVLARQLGMVSRRGTC